MMTFTLDCKMENVNATDDVEEQTNAACGVLSDNAVRNFVPFNDTGKEEKQRTKIKRHVQSKKNVHLYDDDSMDERESGTSTSPFELDEHGIRTSVKALGINHSNLRLEQIWGRRETPWSISRTSTNAEPKVPNQSQSESLNCEKFAKNVLMRSLLKQRRDSTIAECSNETLAEASRIDDVSSMRKQNENDEIPCYRGFIQDSIQPDIYYRPTTVTNPNVDFTIEHVGKKTIVPARKFIIENYNEMDFVFSKKKHYRYKSSTKTETRSTE